MAEDTQGDDQLSEVKASFGWGQLIAGSLIGGLSVWKLLHKLTNTEPSEWFRGIAAAYEQAREFLFLPLSLIHVDVGATQKNLCIVITVLASAVLRQRSTRLSFFVPFWIVVIAMLPSVLAVLVTLALQGYTTKLAHGLSDSGTSFLIFFAILLALFSILGPIATVFGAYETEYKREQSLPLWNVLFTLGSGTTLLLLNWATS